MEQGLEFEPRMNDSDALMWGIEKDPLLRSTITSVFFLDRAPDRQRFRTRIDRISRIVPRLRQRVMGHPFSLAPPRWDVDPNFDLDYHLRWMHTVADGSGREVFHIAEPIAMQGFDRARPLWEFTVVEGLDDGRAAVIAKIHHAVTDGVGGVRLMMELFDLERDPDENIDLPPEPRAESLSEARRMVDALAYETTRRVMSARRLASSAVGAVDRVRRDPVGLGVGALRTVGSLARMVSPATEPLSPLLVDRSLSVRFHAFQLDKDELKRAARTVSGRLNDAFVAGVAGGLQRYHADHNLPVEGLRMTLPVNVRAEADATRAGNQFAPMRFIVPVGIEDPIARMTAIRELVEQQRAEPALAFTDPLAGVLNRLPTTITTAIFGSMLKGVDFVTSNVPGAPIPLYLCGTRLDAQYAFGPMTGAATNITLLSYVDDLNIGVNTDPAAIDDADRFVECLRDSFDELVKLG